jgi:hypothetical protein
MVKKDKPPVAARLAAAAVKTVTKAMANTRAAQAIKKK